MGEHPASCGCPMHGPGDEYVRGASSNLNDDALFADDPANKGTEQAWCSDHKKHYLASLGACPRCEAGLPPAARNDPGLLAATEPETRWQMTRGYGTY